MYVINPFSLLTAALVFNASASFGQESDLADLSFKHGVISGGPFKVDYAFSKGLTQRADSISIRRPYTEGGSEVASQIVHLPGLKSDTVEMQVIGKSMSLPYIMAYHRSTLWGKQRNLWVFPSPGKQHAIVDIQPKNPKPNENYRIVLQVRKTWELNRNPKIDIYHDPAMIMDPTESVRTKVASNSAPTEIRDNHTLAVFEMQGLPKGNYSVWYGSRNMSSTDCVWPLIVE